MVLTNFECWAHGGSNETSNNVVVEQRGNTIDLRKTATFQPHSDVNNCVMNGSSDHTAVVNTTPRIVSHLSSNGYYGFVACNINNTMCGDSKTFGADGTIDVNKQHQPAETSNDVMDVEQHLEFEERASVVPIRSDPTAINTSTCTYNGRIDRRKRLFAEHQILDKKSAPKRFRLAMDSEDRYFQQIKDANQTSMDHEDITIASIQNQSVSNLPFHHPAAQSQQSNNFDYIVDPVNAIKSNSRNTKYNDISRCLTSHLI